MPYNGSGTFTRVYNWVTDKVNGVNITASRVDTEDDGFATGLTNCVTRDGQGKMGADFLPAVNATYALGSVAFSWTTLNGVTITDFARQSQSNTFTAGVSFTGVSVTFQSTLPRLYFDDTDGGANQRLWDIVVNAGNWSLRTRTDADAAGASPISLTRTGTTVDTLNLSATAVQVNSLPVFGNSFAYKTALTARNTTTTLTADNHLTGLVIPVTGKYLVEFGLRFFTTLTTAQGFKCGLLLTNLTNSALEGFYSGQINAANVIAAADITGSANFSVVATSGSDGIYGHCLVDYTVTGSPATVALGWAQNSSSANNTTLSAGSWMRITRVA